jgi:hypothetical protein
MGRDETGAAARPDGRDRESGQYLVLGMLLMVLLVAFVALSVDVGFFLRHRAVVQQAVDAAALAGAQELPDDPAAAEAIVREYIEKNGVDADTLEISFRCTSDFELACDASENKWDTVQVSGRLDVPFFFAPVMKVVGSSGNCWLSSCPVVRSAAACRGVCGGDPTVPVDAVLVLDRTGSMSDGDLDNARTAANTLLDVFTAEYHRVGLAVLGAADPSNECRDAVPGRWLPVGLSDDYETATGALNQSSELVSLIACLDQSAQGTNLGDPVKAAVDHLKANGRPDVKWGIVLLTDGAANEPASGNPCQFAAEQMDAAKAAGIEVYTVGYGTEDNSDAGFTCGRDSGTWEGRTAEQLLAYGATDAQHFFQEAQGEDLAPVFQVIAQSLAGGSRLVPVVGP